MACFIFQRICNRKSQANSPKFNSLIFYCILWCSENFSDLEETENQLFQIPLLQEEKKLQKAMCLIQANQHESLDAPAGTPHTPFNQNEYGCVHFSGPGGSFLGQLGKQGWKVISMQLYPQQHWPCNHRKKNQNSHLSLACLEACLRLGKFPSAMYHFSSNSKTHVSLLLCY